MGIEMMRPGDCRLRDNEMIRKGEGRWKMVHLPKADKLK
jgi:hypothetical protein